MTDRVRRRVTPAAPLVGDCIGTCTSAELAVSTNDNAIVVWGFDVPGGTVKRWTMRRGPGAADLHETAVALSLGKEFRLSQAVGRQCVLSLAKDGQYMKITRARALS